jgi:hypothetical protein
MKIFFFALLITIISGFSASAQVTIRNNATANIMQQPTVSASIVGSELIVTYTNPYGGVSQVTRNITGVLNQTLHFRFAYRWGISNAYRVVDVGVRIKTDLAGTSCTAWIME